MKNYETHWYAQGDSLNSVCGIKGPGYAANKRWITCGACLLLSMEPKYLIIGDVHGCVDEAEELIDKYGSFRDIIFVGDLIDKGPYNYTAVQMSADYFSVLGNHEENHLRYEEHELRRVDKDIPNPMKRNQAFKDVHLELGDCEVVTELNGPSMNAFEYFKTLKPFHRIPEYNVVVLHGGLLPGVKPEDMDPKKIVRLREIKEDGTMATLHEIENGVKGQPWANLYTGDEIVVYGHEPLKEPRVINNTFGIDTGCVYGNKLTGLLLPEFELVSVPARAVYCNRDWHK